MIGLSFIFLLGPKLKIQAKANYLRFSLGPEAGLCSWNNAFCKYKERVSSIASSSRGASISLQRLNSQAVPVLSYICQLLPPSAEMLESELHAFHKMLRMPYTFKRSQFFNLPSLRGPSIRSIGALCFSALNRTARNTVKDVRALHAQLRESVVDNPPFSILQHFDDGPILSGVAALCSSP